MTVLPTESNHYPKADSCWKQDFSPRINGCVVWGRLARLHLRRRRLRAACLTPFNTIRFTSKEKNVLCTSQR